MARIYSVYPSPIGDLTIVCDEHHIKGLYMEGQKHAPGEVCRGSNRVMELARSWLDGYFLGNRPPIKDLHLAPEGTPFQLAVWEILTSIPYGTGITYGQIASQMGNCRKSRNMSSQAVGQAVGANPIGIMIPCHRVLGKGGRLCGYSGGIRRKRWLLTHENIPYRE